MKRIKFVISYLNKGTVYIQQSLQYPPSERFYTPLEHSDTWGVTCTWWHLHQPEPQEAPEPADLASPGQVSGTGQGGWMAPFQWPHCPHHNGINPSSGMFQLELLSSSPSLESFQFSLLPWALPCLEWALTLLLKDGNAEQKHPVLVIISLNLFQFRYFPELFFLFFWPHANSAQCELWSAGGGRAGVNLEPSLALPAPSQKWVSCGCPWPRPPAKIGNAWVHFCRQNSLLVLFLIIISINAGLYCSIKFQNLIMSLLLCLCRDYFGVCLLLADLRVDIGFALLLSALSDCNCFNNGEVKVI